MTKSIPIYNKNVQIIEKTFKKREEKSRRLNETIFFCKSLKIVLLEIKLNCIKIP